MTFPFWNVMQRFLNTTLGAVSPLRETVIGVFHGFGRKICPEHPANYTD